MEIVGAIIGAWLGVDTAIVAALLIGSRMLKRKLANPLGLASMLSEVPPK